MTDAAHDDAGPAGARRAAAGQPPEPPGPVEIRLLGAPEIVAGTGPVELAGRPLALLAVLALSPGEPLPAETLTDRLWDPQDLPARPRATLQTYVARLRGALGAEVVETVRTGYRLAASRVTVDVDRFAELAARDLGASAGERHRDLSDALALWRGDPFHDVASGWLATEARRRLTAQYLDVLEEAADLDRQAGEPLRRLHDVRAACAAHPFRESLWSRLLLALQAAGRRAEALAEYERLRAGLAGELGVDPAPELRDLHSVLLRDGPAGGGPDPDVPRQLPADVTDFTGRESLLAALDARLPRDGGRSVVVLHGPGAVGKTTLAVHWAHRVQERFPGGTLYLNLRGFGPGPAASASEALTTMLGTLGVPAAAVPNDPDGAAALLRSKLSGRSTLLVFDNARDAEQLRPLLPASAACVVVTSRKTLRGLSARGEGEALAVRPLTEEESVALLREGLDEGFRAPEHASALTRLAQLTSGFPLAVRLVAENLRRHRAEGRDPAAALHAVGRELTDENSRLDALDADGDPLADLRAVFSWSYRALDDAAARMFRLVALHPAGGFGVPAAASLAALDVRTARRLLVRLVDASLLDVVAPDRYGMHDLLRAYAADLLRGDRAETDEALPRLLTWAVRSAYAATTTLRADLTQTDDGQRAPGAVVETFEDSAQASAWRRTEGEGLLRLVEDAVATPHRVAAGWLAIRLFDYIRAARMPEDAVRLSELVLRSLGGEGTGDLRGLLLNALAVGHARCGRIDTAERVLLEAREHLASHGTGHADMVVRGNLARVYALEGRGDEAVALARASSGTGAEPADRLTWDRLAALMDVYRELRHIPEMIAVADEMLAALGAVGGRRAAVTRYTRARGHLSLGRPDIAREDARLAVTGYLESGEPWRAAGALRLLGEIEAAAGNGPEAVAAWREALAIVDATGELDATDDLSRQLLIDYIAGVAAADASAGRASTVVAGPA
ncbi:AfsR/SARP family transcriptional regulator [Myceligenerans salitolerans]|uniref:Winged helix-turn-helix domain-containing protein n=1 Tax=Myceligenerans salitolerans TaxID=1230528 RepID=A0ABS3I9H7_9MICO|nr:BTAD domain-containing putative transcriptional regulator [Myceligenerans salitolerans]MBO0609088.1 winged helix-turn-helix domain-containing protein [Myceligenerans salitolerans]